MELNPSEFTKNFHDLGKVTPPDDADSASTEQRRNFPCTKLLAKKIMVNIQHKVAATLKFMLTILRALSLYLKKGKMLLT